MSEYQYYEFLAIGRPLTGTEQEQVLSNRALVTATSSPTSITGEPPQ